MKELGYTDKMQTIAGPPVTDGFMLARVIREHRERYTIQAADGIYMAEITGNLRYSAESRLDFPAVGDWVKAIRADEKSAIIMEVLPRFSILQRQAVGQHGERQVIATNIDTAFIVQAVGHDFNLNRMERYLTICYGAGIKPVVVLTKTDLIDDESLSEHLSKIRERVRDVPVIAISNITRDGYDQITALMNPFETYCFIGSSGVGKSSIVNGLAGGEILLTSEVSDATAKGRHTTSHRQLIILPNKSLIIDTPGMRELGMTDQGSGLEMTYDEIHELAGQCRFNDCTHTSETGCAVLEALDNGELAQEVYENYMKLQREQAHFSATIKEKREKGRKQGKLYKSIMQAKQSKKFGNN